MINTKENIIYFGYGDIVVGSITNTLLIMPIKPPQKTGSILDMNRVEIIGETISFSFTTLKEINDFRYALNLIDPTVNCFAFQDYIFDFSNYNKESVMVIKKTLESIEYYMMPLMAC